MTAEWEVEVATLRQQMRSLASRMALSDPATQDLYAAEYAALSEKVTAILEAVAQEVEAEAYNHPE